MKKTHISLTLFILLGFVFNNGALSWDDKTTHMQLSEYAADNSVLDKNKSDYLRNLGFVDALDTRVKWGIERSIKKWLAKGAELEDKQDPLFPLFGTTRSFNHFLNPLKPWTQAGLNDIWTGESSILWAQDGVYQQNFPEGNWSWQKTSEYYYAALTGKDFNDNVVAPNETTRKEYFARTFRGLGHQMHLLQDTAVPDHVRNDAHPEDAIFGENPFTGNPYFESWAKNNPTFINSLAANPIYPNVSFNVSYNGLAPVTQFYDAEIYDGLNASAGLNQGLAEYTNANFFSDDTIFAAEQYATDNKHYFPFPRKSSTDLQDYIDQNKLPETVIGEDNVPDTSFWIKKTTDGEFIEHFVRPGYFTKYINIFTELYYRTFYRDEKCHEDYAALLTPRAVGYSAGLLNYFFRGTLEITPPAQVAYAVTDGSSTPYVDAYGNYHQQFRSIKAKIRNSTPDTIIGEEIQDGIIQAVAKYKIIPDYMYDLSNYPPDGNVMKDVEYSYSASLPITITSLSSTEASEFTFDFTSSPIPAGITDLYLQVIFKGTLGNETVTAIAVGMKDLMEPTHQVIWNATDMFKLNGHLYTSEPNQYTSTSIKADSMLAPLVDLDDDGIFNEVNNPDGPDEPYIDPHPVTYGIGYLNGPPGPANPFTYSAITAVQTGRYIRVIALLDEPLNNYMVLEKNDNVDTDAQYFHFAFPGVVNQEENGVWQTPTPVTTFRYGLDIDGITQIPIRQHFRTAFFRCIPVEGTDPDGNPICYYSESEAIPGELLPSPIDTVYFP